MGKITAPIIIVNDDEDDRHILEEVCKGLNLSNQRVFFNKGADVIQYLQSNQPTPFIILCDVNIPRMDGFELKERILNDSSINHKSIPFVYWSDAVSKSQIEKSYDLGGNGFFVKGNTFEEITKSLQSIVNYWSKSIVPD